MDTQSPNQPTIADQFIVKVKLLTNEVYQFVINPETTKVSQLKKMILEKINVPLEKQRIVFSGKQLQDDNKVTDYVKESGNTVHLIAKIGGQESTNNTQQQAQQQTQQQQSSQQSPQQPQQGSSFTSQSQQAQQPNVNPFGNLLRGIGLGAPQATTMTFTNMNDLSQGLGGILGSLGIRLPPAQTQPQTSTQPRVPTSQPHNNPFQTPPANTYRPNQQANQPTTSFTTNLPQTSTQQTSTQPPTTQNIQPPAWNVSNQPILRLNQTISSLNLPPQPVLENRNMSLRQQTAQYLRRLQHQYMRMIPQLNRSVQLLNQGRVSHLSEILKLFEAIDDANQHVEEAISRLINLPVNQAQQQSSATQSSQQQQPQIQVQGVQIEVEEGGNLQNFNFNDNLGANIQATIIVQEDNGIDAQIDEQPTVLPTQDQGNQPRVFNQTINLGNGGLSGLLSSLTQPPAQNAIFGQQAPNMGGFNIGGLMSMFGGMMNPQQGNRPPQPQQQQSTTQNEQQNTQQQQTQQQVPQQTGHVHGSGCNHSHNQPQQTQQPTQQQQPQQPQQQFPQIDLGNLASMASMLFNPPAQQQSPQGTTSQPQAPQQNPMGGLMGIFNSLQQSGGMGDLMSMSLGQTLQQGGMQPTIYSSILKSFAGGDLLTCFTSKNFDFLDRKYEQIRQNFLKAISIAGSQEDLVQTITQDLTNLLIPKNNVRDFKICFQSVSKILRKHVSDIVRLTMNRGDVKYSQKVISSLKLGFCQSIQQVVSQINPDTLSNGQSATSTQLINQDLVFQNIKKNSIQLMDEFIQGLSGMFYGFIERDLIRVYNQYKEEQKRKKQRSLDQAASEEELLKQIDAESKKDVEYLKNFKHSHFYHPKAE